MEQRIFDDIQGVWIPYLLKIISPAMLIKFSPQIRRLFEGVAYLKIGHDKYFLSVQNFYSNEQKCLLIVTIRLLWHFLNRKLNGESGDTSL